MTHEELITAIVWWHDNFPRTYAHAVKRFGENPLSINDDGGLLLFLDILDAVYAEEGCGIAENLV